MSATSRIAVIIPAHNEEETVGGVVRAARSVLCVSRVLVVADACMDATALRAREAGAEVIESSEPLGKSQAIKRGVEAAVAEVYVFLDADLRGLQSSHVELLLTPLLHGSCAMCVGIRDRGTGSHWIGSRLPLVSGERALRRDVFLAVQKRHLRGYMLEVMLNEACRVHGWTVKSVLMSGVRIKTKLEKVGFREAGVQYAKMWWQVGCAMLLVRLQK